MELTTKEAVKILERAAELVDQGWAQNAGARDRHRNAVEATSPTAERWCLSGALARARYELSGTTELTEWSLLLGVICRVTAPKCHDLVDWNDAPGRRSHHVSGALRKAAEKLASEAAMNKYLRFHQTCSTEHLTMAEAIEMPRALVRTILDHAESSPQPVEASTRMSESPVFDDTKYAIDKPTIDALKASLQDSGPPYSSIRTVYFRSAQAAEATRDWCRRKADELRAENRKERHADPAEFLDDAQFLDDAAETIDAQIPGTAANRKAVYDAVMRFGTPAARKAVSRYCRPLRRSRRR